MKKLFILLALTVAGCITSALGQDVLYLKKWQYYQRRIGKSPTKRKKYNFSYQTALYFHMILPMP